MQVEHLMYASSFMRASTCIVKPKGAYNGKLMYFPPSKCNIFTYYAFIWDYHAFSTTSTSVGLIIGVRLLLIN